jgi:hypothetical protein
MIVTVRTALDKLICAAPNESSDEPYLWTFFFKLDGDTVRQTGAGFASSIQVHTAGGSHGNLGATGVKAGRSIVIPDLIGDHVTTLRPIEVQVPGEDTLRVPAQYVVVAVLMEEDDSDSDGIENGHQAVRQLIELEVNDFFSGLSGTEIRAEAAQRQRDRGGDVNGHAQAIVLERFDALSNTVRGRAKSAVEVEILAEHTPGFFWEVIDADELLDATVMRFDERDLLNGPVGPTRPIAEELVDLTDEDDAIESMYVLVGGVSTSIKAMPGDLSQTGKQLSSAVGATVEHVFPAARLCVDAGQRTTWSRHDQVEEHTFVFRYPFLPAVWSVEDQDMVAPAGQITLPQKSCRIPFFHPEGRERPGQREEKRDVVIQFTRFRENGLEGIRLRNRPEDGSWYAPLSLDVMVNGLNRVHLLNADFAFDGQAITSPFYAEFNACIDKFRSVGEKYAESVQVGPKELWGPSARQRWYVAQVEEARQLNQAGLLSRSRFEGMQRVAKQRLGIG